MGDVTYLREETSLDIPVDRVLEAAKVCAQVLVIGRTENGSFYFACSTSDLEWVSLQLLRAVSEVYEMDVKAEQDGSSS